MSLYPMVKYRPETPTSQKVGGRGKLSWDIPINQNINDENPVCL